MSESPKALQAFNDYLALGDGRSLEKLAETYRASAGSVPTKHLNTLKDWSHRHSWQARIAGIIIQRREQAERQRADERRQTFEHGLGLDYERARALMRKAEQQGKLLDALTDRFLARVQAGWFDEGTGPARLAHAFRQAHDAYLATLEMIRKESGVDKPLDVVLLVRQRAAEEGIDPDLAAAEVERLLQVTG